MRLLPRLAALAALLPLLAVVRPTVADEIDEAAARKAVATLLEEAAAADVPKAWDIARRLAFAAGKPGLPAIREAAAARTEPPARLALGRALVLLEEETKGLEVLRKLVEDAKAPVALKTAALSLVAREGEEDEADWLEASLDTTFDPAVKVAMAKALWSVPGGDKAKAKGVLQDFLKSQDRDRRAEGALALGEIGAADDAKAVLQELRAEPTERGRSARFLLDLLNADAVSEARLLASQSGGSAATPSSPAGRRGEWPLLDEIRDMLERAYVDEKIDPKKLEDGAASGFTKALDEHTVYFSPEEYAKLLEQLDPTYGGVGAVVSNDPENAARFTISRPIFGGPIYRAGLRTDDIIDKIDGESTLGLPVEECVRRLKGPAGTKVTISVLRPGWTETQDFVLTRANITLPTTAYDVLPGDIGFLQLISFGEDTAHDVHQVLDKLAAQKIKGLIVDVRGNGGGYLRAAVEVVSEFLDSGAVVVTERGRPKVYAERTHRSLGRGAHRDEIPVVILVDAFTASAAEILAGSLRAHGKARLVGTMTFGKGSVQQPNELRSRPGEPFTDQSHWVLIGDDNGNGKLDPGERARRVQQKNGRFDPAEKFTDANGNGTFDKGEAFLDANGSGEWDPAEAFEDLNKNGKWDAGAAFKVTVARYYLPDDTHLEGKYEQKSDGTFARTGGLRPDVEVKRSELDFWERQGQRAIEKTGAVRRYLDDVLAKDPALLAQLARSDRNDPAAYPGFEAFYASLDTKLSKHAVREVVRAQVRRRVEETIGRELVGDIVDDRQIQAAIRELLGMLKVDPKSVPDLAFLADPPPPPSGKPLGAR